MTGIDYHIGFDFSDCASQKLYIYIWILNVLLRNNTFKKNLEEVGLVW